MPRGERLCRGYPAAAEQAAGARRPVQTMTGPLNGGRPGIACGGQGPPAGSESAAVRFLQRRFPSVSSGAFAGGRGDAHFFE